MWESLVWKPWWLDNYFVTPRVLSHRLRQNISETLWFLISSAYSSTGPQTMPSKRSNLISSIMNSMEIVGVDCIIILSHKFLVISREYATCSKIMRDLGAAASKDWNKGHICILSIKLCFWHTPADWCHFAPMKASLSSVLRSALLWAFSSIRDSRVYPIEQKILFEVRTPNFDDLKIYTTLTERLQSHSEPFNLLLLLFYLDHCPRIVHQFNEHCRCRLCRIVEDDRPKHNPPLPRELIGDSS